MLVFITVLGVLVQFGGGVLDTAVLLPCSLTNFLLCMVVPIISLPVPVKLLDYYNKYIFAQALLDTIKTDPAFLSTKIDYHDYSGEEEGEETKREALALAWKLLSKGKMKQADHRGNKHEVRIINSVDTARVQPVVATNKVMITEGTIYLMKFLTSTTMQAIIFLVMLLPFLVVVGIDFSSVSYLFLSSNCYECDLTRLQQYIIMVGGVGIIIVGTLFALLVRRYPDPFGVVQECRLFAQYAATIGLAGFILSVFFPSNQYASFGWFVYLAALITQFITTDLQIFLAKKQGTDKHFFQFPNRNRNASAVATSMKDIETFSSATLQSALDDPVERGYFERHLVGEFAVEIITMYNDCHDFQKSFYDMSEATRRARAKRIIEKHVSDNAVMQVNLPGEMKNELIRLANDQNTPINVDMFLGAENELFGMLLGSFQRYLTSIIYKENHPSSEIQ